MSKQAPREDILTPIHKGIRSMIYELGNKVQKTDFTDVSATEAIVIQLRHEFRLANSTCIVCLIHDHAGHEEENVLPLIPASESKVIDTIIQEHKAITKQLIEISRVSDELLKLQDNGERIEAGNKLNSMVNKLLAFYLAHMNNEEAELLPLMWKYMTDDQMRAIRAKIQMITPPEIYAEWMSWVMPSLSLNELVGVFSGIKMSAPPEVLSKFSHMAEENLDAATWSKVKSRAGL
jgi:hypothetical protein